MKIGVIGDFRLRGHRVDRQGVILLSNSAPALREAAQLWGEEVEVAPVGTRAERESALVLLRSVLNESGGIDGLHKDEALCEQIRRFLSLAGG